MAEIKGVLLNAQTLFLRNHFNEIELEQAKGTLTPQAAALLKPKYLDAVWYPYETSVALRHLMRALPLRRELDPVNVGAFIGQHTFTGVYSSLLANDAAKLVTNMPFLHGLVYRDWCALEPRLSGERSCAIVYGQMSEGVKPSRAVCQSLIGFWAKVLELGIGTPVSGAHPSCVCEGQPRCEFTFAW